MAGNGETLFKSEFLTDEIGNTLVRVELKDSKGRVRLSVISFDDYLALLKGNREASREYVEVDNSFLPKGFVKGWFSDRANFTCVFTVPGKVRFFKYQPRSGETQNYEIPYPDVVVVLSVRGGNVANKRCYALKSDGFTLYQFPYSNVSSEGSICTGNANFNFEEDNIDDFFAVFCESAHNDDYMEVPHYKSKAKFGAFLKKLDGGKMFPESELIETKGGIPNMQSLLDYAAKIAAY